MDQLHFWVCRKGKIKIILFESGHLELVKILRESGCDTNSENVDRWTPFYAACWFYNYEIVKYLIECEEIDKNKPDKYGKSSFWIACERGFVKRMRLLLENDVNIETPNNDGETPFEIACDCGRLSVVSFLLNFDVEITYKCVDSAKEKFYYERVEDYNKILSKVELEMSKRSLILL